MALPKLYAARSSPNSYKPILLATLLHIELDVIDLDYEKGEQRTPEHLAINPRGQVPFLVDGDKTFTDSSAIMVYLAGLHPSPGTNKTASSFWSSDIAEQAAIVDWLAFAASWITTGISTARHMTQTNRITPETQLFFNRAMAKAGKSFEILQKQLDGKDWLVLGRPTIADIAVFPSVSAPLVGDLSMEPYPAVKSWIERVKNLPGFVDREG